MVIFSAALPNDIEALKRLLRARDAELAQARAEASNAEALIAHLQLSIEKMRREVYGLKGDFMFWSGNTGLDSHSKCDTGYGRDRHGNEIQPLHA
jgi:hypothetical protein